MQIMMISVLCLFFLASSVFGLGLGIIFSECESMSWMRFAVFPMFFSVLAVIAACLYKPYTPQGTTLTRANTPELFSFIDEIAGEVGYEKKLEKIILTSGTKISVYIEPSFSNLFLNKQPCIVIGYSLMRMLNKDELSAVISHEIAHLCQEFTFYKAHLARIANTNSLLGKKENGRLGANCQLNAYTLPAYFFNKVFEIVFDAMFEEQRAEYLIIERDMEFEADDIAIKVCGKRSLLNAIVKADIIKNRLKLFNYLVRPLTVEIIHTSSGYWSDFLNADSLFSELDGIAIDLNNNLFLYDSNKFTASFAQQDELLCKRFNRLNENHCASGIDKSSSSVELLPQNLVEVVERNYNNIEEDLQFQTKSYHNYQELLSDLYENLFIETNSMPEALSLIEALIKGTAACPEMIVHELHEHPPCSVFPDVSFTPVSEQIFSIETNLCPVCGGIVNSNTKICPHCDELISE